MNQVIEGLKVIESAGVAGLIIYCLYRLVDKWAPRFLAEQQATSAAMTGLATAVKQGLEDQRETLIAVRVLATEIGDVKRMLGERGQG